ncbi:hypothetical protein [Dysgonomonas sp. 25]|uniref:hypothetical protein n=1 Tax=Dysgonomonas sp. 25 TaxID=2302933 RepID=UPI0013CFA896|nr:hypothetical protein [Dysgonomonas sp. 25]
MADRKFDIEYFEKNNISELLKFTKEDSTKVQQVKSGANVYLEYEMPPNKLYRIYREYYLSGVLKKEGLQLGRMPIGIWKEFDENGNEVRSWDREENLPKKFDYNKVMLLMEKEGWLNTRTGADRDMLRIWYEEKKNRWVVIFLPYNPRNYYQGMEYQIDANSGKIKSKKEQKLVGG